MMVFCDWLHSLTLFSSFACVVARFSTSFFLWPNILWTYQFIHLLVDGHLRLLQFFIIVNNIAVNISVQGFM